MIRDPAPAPEPSAPPQHPPAAPAELQADPAAGLTADEMDVFEPATPSPPERRLGAGVALLVVGAVILVVLVFTLLK